MKTIFIKNSTTDFTSEDVIMEKVNSSDWESLSKNTKLYSKGKCYTVSDISYDLDNNVRRIFVDLCK